MNLHRLVDKSDWATTNPKDYNAAQKIAASTKGIITPGNIATLIGFLIVLYGLFMLIQQELLLGAAALAIGRIFDILDGAIADITKTKNNIGEFFDATIDKISTLLTIGVIFATQANLWLMLALLILPHVFISLIVVYKRSKGQKLHPTRIGKISMALAWVAILGLVISPLITTHWSQLFAAIVYMILFTSSLLGFYAAWQYLQERAK